MIDNRISIRCFSRVVRHQMSEKQTKQNKIKRAHVSKLPQATPTNGAPSHTHYSRLNLNQFELPIRMTFAPAMQKMTRFNLLLLFSFVLFENFVLIAYEFGMHPTQMNILRIYRVSNSSTNKGNSKNWQKHKNVRFLLLNKHIELAKLKRRSFSFSWKIFFLFCSFMKY